MQRQYCCSLALASLVPYDSSSTSASEASAEDQEEANGSAADSTSLQPHLPDVDEARAGPAAQLYASVGGTLSRAEQQRVRSFEHRPGDYAVTVYISGELHS